MKLVRSVCIVTAILLAALATPTRASAQCVRCCFYNVLSRLSVAPTTAEEGQPVTITTTLYNCGFSATVVSGTTSLSALACQSFSESYSFKVYMARGAFRTLTYTFLAPKCDGTYKIAQKVKSTLNSTAQYNTAYLKVN